MPRVPALALSALFLASAVSMAAPSDARAQATLLAADDGPTLTLSGYVRSLTGLHDLGYEVAAGPGAPATARRSGFHGEVIRLKWSLAGGAGPTAGGTSWRLDVHNRLQARVSNAAAGTRVVGFGVSAVPDRLVDLETTLVDEPGLRAWHDVDRLSISLYTDIADITVGRQAITWGVSNLFPVADLWARFSPFELDTEEKPGIDAIRILAYPAGLEIDAVIADRGSAEDLSAGVRATWGLPSADLWAGAGKFWRQAMVMGGVTVLLETAKLRAEAVLPWDLDARAPRRPRATVGVDWIRGTLVVSGEYHYNGIGADAGDYLTAFSDPRVARGETYYVGRHYLGGVVSWSPDRDNRMALVLSGLANLTDPSVALTPLLGYDIGQAARVSIGGLLSIGDRPSFDTLPPSLPTEFGAYGTLGFTQLSIYF